MIAAQCLLLSAFCRLKPVTDRSRDSLQAVVMGTRRSLSVSLKDCGICGAELADYRRHVGGPGDNGGAGAVATEAASVQLACKHLFHPSCIKGWTLVGALRDGGHFGAHCHYRPVRMCINPRLLQM